MRKGFSDKEASVVHAVLNSVRKAAGVLEEKNKEESQVASKMTKEIEKTALPIADLKLKFPDTSFCNLTIGKFSFSNGKHAAIFLQEILAFYKGLFF